MNTFLIVAIVYIAISLTISLVLEVYLIPKKNKYLEHIKNHKLQSKTYLLSKVKIPEYVFNRFNKDIKNAFILGYILIVYYTLFNLSYIIIQIVVIITQKVNVIDEQSILLILPFLASILGIKGKLHYSKIIFE
ncbi:hypothetical protein [Mycoplasma zalophidermidis]|uniref:Uncharacterized protein n=1 Tax=Mycoplasma zalophidermidis TaxID=398174 RepID=A0ABS6DSL2_9MOLU|nr:hypothetical protein [Mycoplasma zalophidermidis]MBU4689571.1 hypothetical protein [Mycoplasma zalophidermidis]MBU4693468.1 hypothetical protein [Mycoplasma zalophidermidis]MCR8966254.1 hypothetical protein [Mycoplasma zalophidermidis]